MASWVHCNKCFIKLENNKGKFFLTECGHVTCERCTEKIKLTKLCILCSKTTCVLQLSNDIEPSIQQFFHPVDNLLKKAIEVYNFQITNRNKLFENLQNKYNYAKKECFKFYSDNRKLMQENKSLRAMLRSTGQNAQPFLTSTPADVSNDTFQDVTMSSITPKFAFKNANNVKPFPLFTPVPGFARRMPPVDQLMKSERSGSSQGPSPVQVVPMQRKSGTYVPTHRNYMGAMTSMDDLRRACKPGLRS